MTIYEVKQKHLEKFPKSHFFDRSSMKFFGQRLKDFRVCKSANPGLFAISAPMYIPNGAYMGDTMRLFNPETGELKNLPN
jgi:hypothetical protein